MHSFNLWLVLICLTAAANTQCPMFLDADMRFYTQWAGPCLNNDTISGCATRQLQRVMVTMVDIVHRADGIYDVNFNGSVRLGLAGLAVRDPLMWLAFLKLRSG